MFNLFWFQELSREFSSYEDMEAVIESKEHYSDFRSKLNTFGCPYDEWLKKLYVDYGSSEFNTLAAKIECTWDVTWVLFQDDEPVLP